MEEKKVSFSVFAGKEKAWASAIFSFLAVVAVQKLGLGSGPSIGDIASFTSVLQEIVVALVTAGGAFFSTWLTANTGTPKTVEVPVEELTKTTVGSDALPMTSVTKKYTVEENPV